MSAHNIPGRFVDWPERLANVLMRCQRTPFAWGEHDCCLFAATVVQELTGVDPAAAWRGTYATEAEALALIDGAGGLLDMATHVLGPRRDDPQLAQRGDVVCALIYPEPLVPRWLLGIVTGTGWCAPGARGLVHRKLDDVVAVWAI